MLEVRNIQKSYTTGDFTQVALGGVNLAFRSNEFVAILGPSGSGKTTLLNIVGGLDAYDDGDLLIDGVSTTRFTDRDWDTYRNNRIGFVFQSYNLIPHQSVLANVELALTLSGVSRGERRRRAMASLQSVGLEEHAHKRPNQLSGGQMQRVAIARALINDPEILLADEPTGALDSATSLQIMALLEEIARDRLVIMVTHNPDLADRYANRIITLNDGLVVSDTNPYEEPEATGAAGTGRRTRMGSLTALGLSLANLLTKRGRTAMTAFAGSIGIIGIAAILALANGVNDYIRTVEEDTLSVYPLSIQSQGLDMAMFIAAGTEIAEQASAAHEDERVHEVQILSRMMSSVGSNDLGSLKDYFDDGAIDEYVSSIQYTYDIDPHIYSENPDGTYAQVHPDRFSGSSRPSMGFGPSGSVFNELVSDTSVVETQYDVVRGRWPQAADELLVVLSPNGDINDFTLYAMGLRDRAERDELMRVMVEGGTPPPVGDPLSFTPDELMDVTFELAHATDYYVYDEDYDVWVDKHADEGFVESLLGKTELTIVGVVQPKEGATASALNPGIFYTPALTREVVSYAQDAPIVAEQKADRAIDVFTGRPFTERGASFAREDFDMSSLLSIDSEAIAEAFSIDTSAFQLPSLNLSGMNLSMPELTMPEISLDPSDLPPLDIEALLGGLDIDVEIDEAEATALVEEFTQGYVQFALAEGHDPADVQTVLPLYVATEEAAAILDQVTEMTEPLQEQVQTQVQQALGAYMQEAMNAVMAKAGAQIGASIQGQLTTALTRQMGSITRQIEGAMQAAMTALPDAMSIDEEALAAAFEFNLDEDELTEIIMAMALEEQRTPDGNLRMLGYAEYDKPANIDIYPLNFEAKESIIGVLDAYNERMEAAGEEGKVVTYTDLVGTLMSSVTDILNVITYVLVAFVAISLVVSSIMIGVITYISVLERRKEIGILRAVGASKGDIRRVFNAETLIIGFLAGVFGIGITFLLTLPANAIVNARFGIEKVAILPWVAALILVAISMGLTFIAGLLPASSAARKDPVEALRSE